MQLKVQRQNIQLLKITNYFEYNVQLQFNNNLQINSMQISSVDRSYNYEHSSKNQLMNLLKRIAQLQLREAKYIEKIKYLETANARLTNQKQEQLKLMECHPTSQIQDLIKNLQGQIKRISIASSEKIEKQRSAWLKRYEEIADKNARIIDNQKEKRIQLEYQVRVLKQIKMTNQPNFNATMNSKNILQLENEKLKRDLEEYVKKNKKLESECKHLQYQIQGKFEVLDKQITLYQQERQESVRKIKRLEQELRLRENSDGFSFCQKQVERCEGQGVNILQFQGMGTKCYKSSIGCVLLQNNRLKDWALASERLVRQKEDCIGKQKEM